MPATGHERWWMKKPFGLSTYEPNHPGRVALRAYGLALTLSLGPALTLSLGPALIPFITHPLRSGNRKFDIGKLLRLLKRELRYDGFAFGIATVVAGGPALRAVGTKVLTSVENLHHGGQPRSSSLLEKFPCLKTYLHGLDTNPEHVSLSTNAVAAVLGFLLLRSGRERTAAKTRSNSANGLRSLPTLDLTLLAIVRAVDALVQSFIQDRCTPTGVDRDQHQNDTGPENQVVHTSAVQRVDKQGLLTSQLDAFTFWLCSARIMWCYFYEPKRLPGSYVKWITTLANVDERLLDALRLIRTNDWSYLSNSKNQPKLLDQYATSLGYPSSWGNPGTLPAYGGAAANATWKQLGVTSRPGVGGIPCELVHGRMGESLGLSGSCHTNITLRTMKAFLQALVIYLPVHLIPILITRPKSLLQLSRVLSTGASLLRSTAFLASFISLYWYSVCFTRSIFLAKLLPFVSHQFWDGPYGCILAGSLACGTSIWVENGRRRGEMALYVLPRALRTCLPQSLSLRGVRLARFTESGAFVLSVSILLQTAAKRPGSLRGLSRWALDFVLNGTESLKNETTRGKRDNVSG